MSQLPARQIKGEIVKIFRALLLLFLILSITACKPDAKPTNPLDVEESAVNTPVDEAEDPAPPEEEETVPPWPEDAIIVTSTEDSGAGTFRWALESAQDNDWITFDPAVFPPDAPATIFVLEELPHIRANGLTIDASNTGVILDGSQLEGDWVLGLQVVETDGVTIMGLQIAQFPGSGIGIGGNNNFIGGDRSIGDGPWGQGNLLVRNVNGMEIDGMNNTITGNLIGIDLDEAEWLGNERYGIQLFENAQDNTIGPNNINANNGEFGVYTSPEISGTNTFIQNEVYDNGIGRGWPIYPALFDFDLTAGTVTGATCPNCTIEIFSANGYEGEILEGETTADANGIFTYDKGEPFTGPMLTARTTTTYDRPSGFIWPPSSSTQQTLAVQTGNTLPRTQFFTSLPKEIPDNHIATQYDGIAYEDDFTDLAIYGQGVTRARVSTNGVEPHPTMDWNKPEMPLSQAQQNHFTRMSNEGIIVTFMLVYWDKENNSGPESLPCYRFQTEEEIEDWLVYVRYIVETLHDRVQYFEIWNEPDIANFCPKSIYLDDYINLIKRTAPVIHEIAPEAKVVVGGVSGMFYDDSYNYLLGVLRSDAMPLVDVISWHPMYNFSPDIYEFSNYYYTYPEKIQEIKDTAAASGFVGEYHADEISYRSEVVEDQPGVFTQVGANKYFLQSAIMHRGEGIDIGLGSGYYVIRKLSTAIAGVEPEEFTVEVETNIDHLISYTFSTLDGDKIIGIWKHTKISEFDPGVETAITIPGVSASRVVAIDLLYNMEQELIFEIVNGNLVIENLLVKDYPILIQLEN